MWIRTLIIYYITTCYTRSIGGHEKMVFSEVTKHAQYLGMARPWIGCLICIVITSTMFYFYLFSNVAERENSKKLLQAELESKKIRHPGVIKALQNETKFPIPNNQYEVENNTEIECNIIHIAMVCAGYNSTFATVTVVKSILFYRRNPLHFHLVVDEIANRTLFALFESWNLPNVDLTYYKSAELVPQVAWIPNKHYSGVYGLLKLVLPEILNEDKVIVLDTDVTVLTDIVELWKLFENFGIKQVIGLVENQSDWYLKSSVISPTPWPALGRGFNTGVMLMHLKRIRSMKFLDTWREISQITLKVIPETHLADQDIINAVIKENPDILHRLECTWNIQLSVNTLSENCYTNTNKINIIHWNSPTKQDVRNKHIDDFRKAYQIFLELDGNLLRRQLFLCSNQKVALQSEKGYSPCERFEKSAAIKYRTHLFLLEYEYDIESVPDVTLITQCSADRLTLLEDLCKRWTGPISVALYFTDADTHNFMNFVRESQELKTRRNIAYHVVYKEGEFYPVNYLRNIGISHVRTPYIFQLDVDFLPSNNLYDTLLSNIIRLELKEEDNKVALIIPAFETERYRFIFPSSKDALVKSLNRGIFYTFRYHIWSQGHAATNYTHWCKASEPYEVVWEPDFEPYVVVPNSAPKYDTRFVGFGWNKVSHIAHLVAMGYRYIVLPDGFVIHRPHAPSLDIIKFRQNSLYRRCLKKLKDTFVQELLTKYEDSAVSIFKKYSYSSIAKIHDERKQKT